MAAEATERRLAAIMFTDIVGYTALMAKSEEQGLRVRQRHREVVRPLVERYHGEWIESPGDQTLSTFPTALDAVNCGLAVDEALGDDAELKLHVGIHLGDLVVQGGEVSGDGVNIASRICALSEGGGLCVSGEVYRSIRNQPEIEATPLGEQKLKNVPEPVAVYAVTGTASPPRAISTPRWRRDARTGHRAALIAGVLIVAAVGGWWLNRGVTDLAPIRSIAVLPLENISNDPEQDYFAAGMTEALISDLARIASLRVTSRTSVLRYANTEKPIPEIARELGVDAVLEGTVAREGSRLRITTQLIDAASDTHIWAHRYDRELRGVLALQSEVAREVARQVGLELTPQDEFRLSSAPPVNPAAHDAYMRGRHLFFRNTHDDMLKAVEQYEEALRIDPDFALAYAGLADAYT